MTPNRVMFVLGLLSVFMLRSCCTKGRDADQPSEVTASPAALEALMTGRTERVPPWQKLLEAKIDLRPDTPGDLRLDDGVLVRAPAGAVTQPAELRLAKHELGNAELKAVRYELRLSGGQRLARPLEVTFPLSVDPGGDGSSEVSGTPRVHHVSDGRLVETLPARVDAGARTATITLRSLSDLVPDFLRNRYTLAYLKARSGDTAGRTLDVPYVTQDDYGWCWAASISMLFTAYKAPYRIWDVASIMGKEPEGGMIKSITPLQPLADPHGLKLDEEFLGSLFADRINGYLVTQLAQGRPVLYSSRAVEHTFVVVGFDKANLFVNDPSGHLILKAFGKEGQQKLDEALNANKLVAYPIPWDRWNEAVVGYNVPILSPNLWGSMCTVVRADMPDTRTLSTIEVTPKDHCLEIQRRLQWETGAHRAEAVMFWWNGLLRRGHGFSKERTDSDFLGGHLSRKVQGGPLCNSDVIGKLHPSVANARPGPARMRARAWLDDKKLGESETVEVPAHTSSRALELTLSPDAISRLNFFENPLEPGVHRFRFEALVNDAVTDTAEVAFEQVPAVVRGLKVTREGDRDTLLWEPNPEEKSLGRTMHYRVWVTPQPRAAFAKLVAETRPGEYTASMDLTPEQKKSSLYYAVVAIDDATGYASPTSVFVKPTSGAMALKLIAFTRDNDVATVVERRDDPRLARFLAETETITWGHRYSFSCKDDRRLHGTAPRKGLIKVSMPPDVLDTVEPAEFGLDATIEADAVPGHGPDCNTLDTDLYVLRVEADFNYSGYRSAFSREYRQPPSIATAEAEVKDGKATKVSAAAHLKARFTAFKVGDRFTSRLPKWPKDVDPATVVQPDDVIIELFWRPISRYMAERDMKPCSIIFIYGRK